MLLQFWELDNDHDFLISKDDLVRYGNHSLTYRIVERIFQQVRQCSSVMKQVVIACLLDHTYIQMYCAIPFTNVLCCTNVL